MSLPHRPAGASGLDVSVLALGSWRTYERIPREQGVAVLDAARETGIDFVEIARYNDESGTAPITTGYSEVVFGEVFSRSAYAAARDELIVAEKLWWEFWPGQSAVEELEGSLERTGLDRVDLLYCDPTPAELPMEQVVETMGELVGSGRVRAWAIVNWTAERLAEAGRIALDRGLPTPCLAQLPYNLVHRDWVEGADMVAALELCQASVVASFTLAGGVFSGKYSATGAGAGRMAGELSDPRWAGALQAAQELRALADELGTTPAALAIAFALANPAVATVLFGATRPEQVQENARAVTLLDELDEDAKRRLRDIGT